MGARSEARTKHILVVVDRASKFLFAYPPSNNTAENEAKKRLELLSTFGMPLPLRSNPGTGFTAAPVKHFCKWLNVTIDYGPTGHPRAQRAVERLGGGSMKPSWNLARLSLGNEMNTCGPTLWLHRTTPDPWLPGKVTLFRLLFGQNCRTQMNATSPSPDDDGMDGLLLIADKSENLRQVQEVRKDLQHRHDQSRLRREHHNAGINRPSTGTRGKRGDLVLVKEADSALYNNCVHGKPTHDRWTEAWTVTTAITPGLCYCVTFQGRRERVRRAAASYIKPYHLRPLPLRHDFGDEYAHLAWGSDLGLGTASTLTLPLYTLVDRCTIQLPYRSWEWRYRGRYRNGSLSRFITEAEWLESFSLMQLDVFHTLWELHQPPRHRPRLAAESTSSESLAVEHILCWRYLPELWLASLQSQGLKTQELMEWIFRTFNLSFVSHQEQSPERVS